MAPWWSRATRGTPFVTLKLATSLDGCIALADGSSHWITGARARAHAHRERALHEGSLVGRGTLVADAPRLYEKRTRVNPTHHSASGMPSSVQKKKQTYERQSYHTKQKCRV